MAKNTYGTGSFVLLNVGPTCPPPTEGMLTTVAWQLADGTVAYALEGAMFVTGAAVQWLRDGLGLIETSAEIGPLAASTPDNGGVYLVPAFTGLGSPWWDPYARGTIVGITRGTSKAHIARAVVEAMAYQTRDVVEAMAAASGTTLAVAPRRRWCVGDGRVVANASRSTRRHRSTSERPGDHRTRSRISGRIWPRASGRRWRRSTSAGRSTPRSSRRP